MNKLTLLLFLLILPSVFARTYCLNNETLAIEKETIANISNQENNITSIEYYKCKCLNDSCSFEGITILEMVAFAIPILLIYSGNKLGIRMISILGSLMLLVYSVFLLSNDIVFTSKGIPLISNNYSLLKTLAFILLGFSVMSIFYDLLK